MHFDKLKRNLVRGAAEREEEHREEVVALTRAALPANSGSAAHSCTLHLSTQGHGARRVLLNQRPSANPITNDTAATVADKRAEWAETQAVLLQRHKDRREERKKYLLV